jgi:hypothetical protein
VDRSGDGTLYRVTHPSGLQSLPPTAARGKLAGALQPLHGKATFRKRAASGAPQDGGATLGNTADDRCVLSFPQVRKVSLVELGTHVEFAFVFGGWHDSEKKLVEGLFESIPDDALLIEDRGFFSYRHWKMLHEKHKLLVRVQKSMVFKRIKTFDDGSFLAKIYPSNWYRENDKQGIVVRVIEYKLDDPQRTGH